MVTAKEAVQISSAYVADLFQQVHDLRLEQVAPHGQEWEVIFSFRPDSMAFGASNRVFKAVEVDRESGEPRAVKIWQM